MSGAARAGRGLRWSVALLLLWPAGAHAQLLGRASSAVRSGDSESGSSQSYDDDDDDSDYDDDYDDDYDRGQDDDDSVLRSASHSVRGRGRPGRGGWSRSGGSSGRGPFSRGPSRRTVFCAYPYEDGASGQTRLSEPGSDEVGGVALRLHLEGGYALAGAGRLGLGARLQLPIPLELTVRYSAFFEPLAEGIESVVLGRVGVAYRVFDLPEVQLRLGAALRHFHDALGAVMGADAELGLDIFPVAPLVLSLNVTAGFVGEAAVVDARASLGVLVDGWEIYGGYHYAGLFAGGHVDLGGPMLGVRGWI